MNLRDQIQREAVELDAVEETLSRKQKDRLKDFATWVKEKIEQDSKNLGNKYEHFLHEQAKAFAYQGGWIIQRLWLSWIGCFGVDTNRIFGSMLGRSSSPICLSLIKIW